MEDKIKPTIAELEEMLDKLNGYYKTVLEPDGSIKSVVIEQKLEPLSEEKVFNLILKEKYPNGFPLLSNHGASMKEVYPKLWKLAKAICQRFGTQRLSEERIEEIIEEWTSTFRGIASAKIIANMIYKAQEGE